MLEGEHDLAEMMRRADAGSARRAVLAGGACDCVDDMLAAVERMVAAVERELSTPGA